MPPPDSCLSQGSPAAFGPGRTAPPELHVWLVSGSVASCAGGGGGGATFR